VSPELSDFAIGVALHATTSSAGILHAHAAGRGNSFDLGTLSLGRAAAVSGAAGRGLVARVED